jgi:hypothetical protein
MSVEHVVFLVLTKQDLARLSPELRAELQVLIFSKKNADHAEIEFADWGISDGTNHETDRENSPPWPDSSEKSGDGKKVIDISVEEAKALIGNLSDKSIATLKQFASSESVAFDSLVGPENAYESLSDLKRSFVGAVNRRLRTVTRNRSAVLFRKVEGENGLSIEVRPMTAAALKKAMSQETIEDA